MFCDQIIQNDVHAHEGTIGNVNAAGAEVISSEGGATATGTRNKLDRLNKQWQVSASHLQAKTE